MVGWVKMHRSIISWEWFKDLKTRAVFEYLFLEANRENKSWRTQSIFRGQLVTTVKDIAYKNGLSVQQTRSALKNLQNTGEITIKTTNKFSIITVVNYGKFQNAALEDNKQNQSVQQSNTTIEHEHNSFQTTTPKEEEKQEVKKKEVKKSRKNKLSSNPAKINVFKKEKEEFSPLALDWWPSKKICLACNEAGLSDTSINLVRERFIKVCNRDKLFYPNLDKGFLNFMKTYISTNLRYSGMGKEKIQIVIEQFIHKTWGR